MFSLIPNICNNHTFGKREHIEDAMACITSTAEPIASFKLWMSACWKINVMVIISLYCEDFGTNVENYYSATTHVQLLLQLPEDEEC